ncbi:MAG: rhodanese-like domain-containing protein [Bacteroidia bacterium]|nr:rhodanese-like domain-containing protein [Bacteroidia bacterium]
MLSACGQPSIESTLERLNRESVPYISAEELNSTTGQILLDTRSKDEYEVSHLQGAKWVGYKKFDIDEVLEAYPDKNTPMVVYCSVGVRSENIGEKLQNAGYTDVKNLYGGIFEWKNKDFLVYTPEGNSTEKVHVYGRRWGRLLHNAEKIY